jgi:hypothetical protein
LAGSYSFTVKEIETFLVEWKEGEISYSEDFNLW